MSQFKSELFSKDPLQITKSCPTTSAAAKSCSVISTPVKSRPLLITFEGIDGAGKSTQIEAVCQWLSLNGIAYVCKREPGGTYLGEKIREILKDPDPSLQIDPLAELLLFTAARAQLVKKEILPALAAKQVVILDRFIDSTMAYQGAGRELGLDLAKTLCEIAIGDLKIDRTYYLALSREAAQVRLANSRELISDRLDAIKDAAFWERIMQTYEKLAQQAHYLKLDANLPVPEISDLIIKDLQTLLDA